MILNIAKSSRHHKVGVVQKHEVICTSSQEVCSLVSFIANLIDAIAHWQSLLPATRPTLRFHYTQHHPHIGASAFESYDSGARLHPHGHSQLTVDKQNQLVHVITIVVRVNWNNAL